jgi:hypothetical protein
MGAIDDKQRQDIIRKFEEDQRRVMGMMSQERDRQLRVLETKLRSRRERHARKAEVKLRKSMEREQKLMRQRIAHVAETAQKSIAQAEHSAKAASLVFNVMHKKGKLRGEESAVHMTMIGNMAKSWKNKARQAKERRMAIAKAAKDMQTPAQRAAARSANKGFWNSTPELSEEEQAELQKKNLEEVERLHKAMEKELHQNKSDMSEKAKNRHGKLLARLEAKKKRLAKKSALAKKRADMQAKAEPKPSQVDEPTSGDAASTSTDQPTEFIPPSTPVSRRGGANSASTDSAMTMAIPTAQIRATTGGGGGGFGAMDPAKEARLFSTLSMIEKKLSAIEVGSGGAASSALLSPLQRAQAASRSGADLFAEDRVKDRQFRPEGQLKESNVSDLGDHERQRLAFGSEILKIFGMDRGTRKVNICVASSLPSSGGNESSVDYDNNAFANSFHWDGSSRTLYVRQERLESVGEFALMLVHTLAHIQADPRGSSGSMGNDADPKFISQFVKGMKLVTQSLFMTSQQVEKLRLIRPSGDQGKNQKSQSSGGSARAAAEDEYYKTASLQERMERYRAFRNRPELLSFVSNIDGSQSSVDDDASGGSNVLSNLGARLDQQISSLQKDVDASAREYRDQLSKQVSVLVENSFSVICFCFFWFLFFSFLFFVFFY